jgi:hypothetical protein
MNITILKVKEKSTLIQLSGKQIEVPVVLDKNKSYQAVLKNDEIFIIEKKDSLKNLIKNEIENKTDKASDKLFLNKDESHSQEVYNFPLMDILKKIIDDQRKNRESKDLYFSDKKKEDYFFVFDLSLFNRKSKVFLKIDKNKNVYLNFLAETGLNSAESRSFTRELKKRLNKKINLLNITFLDKNKDFYDKIVSLFNIKNVDIKI